MPSNSNLSINGDSMEKLKTLQISSLDDEPEEEEEEEEEEECENMDDDEDDDLGLPVELGFVKKPNNGWLLLRQYFPCKAGGVPAWLDPNNLPEKSSACGFCGMPLQFLLQVYAPISEKDSAFHRTLFVFMCPSMACLLKDQHEQWKRQQGPRSVKVFRCQLARQNPFYSYEPPRDDGNEKPSEIGAALCTWCGTWKGDKLCGSCRAARYCSKEHQKSHWHSDHQLECRKLISSSVSESTPNAVRMHKVLNKNLWPEFEIIIEEECESDREMAQDSTSSIALVPKVCEDESVKSLVKSFEADVDKQSWASFQQRITKAPEQVLRYCRDARASPLWPMSSGRPSKADVPKCFYCGDLRCHEFQILPQLLYYFGVKNDVDSLDWATIVVYACEDSCESNLSYKEEFAWVQLSSPSAVVP